jgi:4-aminobutyrate aminotransferase-like enzyme
MSKLQDLQKKYNIISSVRGCGLLIAVEFNKEMAESVMYSCLEKGLVINLLTAKILRVIPPLIITNAEIDKGIKVLDEVLGSMK